MAQKLIQGHLERNSASQSPVEIMFSIFSRSPLILELINLEDAIAEEGRKKWLRNGKERITLLYYLINENMERRRRCGYLFASLRRNANREEVYCALWRMPGISFSDELLRSRSFSLSRLTHKYIDIISRRIKRLRNNCCQTFSGRTFESQKLSKFRFKRKHELFALPPFAGCLR